MGYLEQATTAKTPRGARIILYGQEKIGKSTFASEFPNHIFLNLENGLSQVDKAKALPYTDQYEVVKAQLRELATEDHPYKTLIIDSGDALENIISKDIALAQRDPKIQCVADIPFGRGYPNLIAETGRLIEMLEYISEKKQMNIIIIAHESKAKIQTSAGGEYMKSIPTFYWKSDTGRGTLDLWKNWADIILFSEFKIVATQIDSGFDKSKVKAIGTGERVLRTNSDNPNYLAGSRMKLPNEMRMDANEFMKALSGEPKKEKTTTEKKGE